MNKFISTMAILVVVLFTSNSFAWTPPASPAPESWISDTSGVLSSAAHTRLDSQLTQINQSSANELAALIVPSLEGEDISDIANTTFKAWGVGKKGLDNGVLVVLAMKEHKSRIETGKGVEGDLPDLKTQDILTQVVRPHMKRGDVEGALSASFSAISTSIANHKAEAAEAAKHPSTSSCDVGTAGANGSAGFLILACLALMIVLFVARSKRQREDRILAESARLAAANRAEAARKLREAQAKKAVAPKPVAAPKPVSQPIPMPTYHPPTPVKHESHSGEIAAAAILAEAANRKASEISRTNQETYRNEREAEIQRANKREAEARKSREETAERRRRDDEVAADRRRRDEESRRSSSDSSSSSWDSGSSSSSDSGSFGGGDSGGGGSDSSW